MFLYQQVKTTHPWIVTLWMEAGVLPRRGGLDRLNIRSCRRQLVPVLNGPWKERHLIHCDIGVRDEKPLWPSCSTVVGPHDGFWLRDLEQIVLDLEELVRQWIFRRTWSDAKQCCDAFWGSLCIIVASITCSATLDLVKTIIIISSSSVYGSQDLEEFGRSMDLNEVPRTCLLQSLKLSLRNPRVREALAAVAWECSSHWRSSLMVTPRH